MIRPAWLAACLLTGGLAAGGSFAVSAGAMDALDLDSVTYARYGAPLIEELAKSLLVLHMIRTHKVGFLVDAAIYGFAVGAGFAVVENVYYVGSLPGVGSALWTLRGFGTAVMHGGATCLVAIVTRALVDRKGAAGATDVALAALPGLALATVVHSLYNHALVSPLLGPAAVLIGLPPLLFVVFTRSERALQRWLDVGFDADTELLELLDSGRLSESPIGRYLESVRTRFRGRVAADMLCYLRLHVELALRAKGRLLMREHGFEPIPLDEETEAKLKEMAFLERSIGATGKAALAPFLQPTGRELWQLFMLSR